MFKLYALKLYIDQLATFVLKKKPTTLVGKAVLYFGF